VRISSDGRHGDEILEHPHFLSFLWYFIYGAKLPERVVVGFRQAVDKCGQITSSDVVPLGKTARQLAKAARLPAFDASEEFYKLALDCGIWHSYAAHIHDDVRRMR
jgi:hypothetical protein